MQIISRPTRREREERLAESRTQSSQRNVEGVVRATEEAHDIQRQREREGHAFDRPYAVSGNAVESKRAEAEVMLRAGATHDAVERALGKEALR